MGAAQALAALKASPLEEKCQGTNALASIIFGR
jgi:hypothetical protein